MTDQITVPDESAAAAEKKAAEAKAIEDAKKAEEVANAKKDPKDHIIDRLAKREQKLKDELAELAEDQKVLTPTSKEPSFEELFNRRAEMEETISKYVEKYPELDAHREKIRKYAHDPSRKGVPIDEVIIGAVGIDEFIKIGAKIQQEAEEDERTSQMGGRNAAGVRTKTDEEKRKEKFNKMPKFLSGSQKAYDEQFNH